MMRRLAARKSDPLPSNSSTDNNGSNENLHLINRRLSSNNKLTDNDDDDAAAKSRHSWCRNYLSLSSSSSPLGMMMRSIHNLLTQLKQHAHSLFHRFKCYLERIDPIYAAAICIFLFVTICTLVVIEILLHFGPRGSIKGGVFGRVLDQCIKDYTRYQTMSKWKTEVKSVLHLPIVYREQDGGITDQRWYPLGDSLSSRPNFAIVEMLLREKRRKSRLGEMIHDAVIDVNSCSNKMVGTNNSARVVRSLGYQQQSLPAAVVMQFQTNNGQQVVQVTQLLPYWLTNLPAFVNGVEAVTVDYSDDIDPTNNNDADSLNDQLLQFLELNYSKDQRRREGPDFSIPKSIQNCPKFIIANNNNNNNNKDNNYYYASRTDPTLHCLGYFLGGMQLGDDNQVVHQARPHITNLFTNPSLYKQHATMSSTPCNSKVGYTVLSRTPTPDDQVRKSSSIWSHVSTIFSAFPPNHPAYMCLPPLHPNQVGISPYNTANEELSFQSTFVNQLLTAFESKRLEISSSSESILWGVATLPCEFNDFNEGTKNAAAANCCNQVSVTMLDSAEVKSFEHHLKKNNERKDKPSHHLFFTFVTVPELDDRSRGNSRMTEKSAMQVSVSISERNQKHKRMPALQYKESIQKKMRHKSWRCEPGWWCNRCLQASVYGSFSSCYFVCGKCAPEFICNEREKETQIDINVKVNGNLPQKSDPAAAGTPKNGPVHRNHQRIPRIIHQTYFEEITKETFPQLVRLQNTWKASGWEYRFYSDDTAREYIRTHYPERFVSVFDTLLPGAYKADFFRYLVLFKEGGIYADIDVMLDANLDQFITPDLAFFAPIDSVGVYADESFCLWNGLIGSAPAHPALANAIEWMVNLVSSRGDLYDVERAVCEVTGIDKMENWKIRAEPGLILSGPCALGLAVNNALGKESLSKFVPGLMRLSSITSAHGSMHRESDDVIGDVMILVVSCWGIFVVVKSCGLPY